MKEGFLKLTLTNKNGFVYVQCEKVLYVHSNYEGAGQCTVVGMIGGSELYVTESPMWCKDQMCPH
jgi:hypothetical protein